MEHQLQHSTIFPLETAYKIVVRRAEDWLQTNLGLTRRELWVLLCVDESQCNQKQIGETLRLGPNIIVELLKEMEDKQLLERSRRVEDRREQWVFATDKGLAALQIYHAEHTKNLREVFSPLTEEEVSKLREMTWSIIQGFPLVGDMDEIPGSG